MHKVQKGEKCKSVAVFAKLRFGSIFCPLACVLWVLRFLRASVHGVRCPGGGFWSIVSRQLDWIPHRFRRGRADDPANRADRLLQVMRRRLQRLLQGSNITTAGKTLTSFPTVGKTEVRLLAGQQTYPHHT